MTWNDTARTTLRALFAGGLACALFSCGSGDSGARTIDKTREREAPSDGVRWNAPPSQRFGMRMSMPPASGAGALPGGEAVHGLTWETPKGWTELAPSQMRVANFLAGDPRAECYLSRLAGDGGGLEANVNRWRGQMSLPPASSAEVGALPSAQLFGGRAALLDVRGTWKGMGGNEQGEDYRMLGLLRVAEFGSAFLKLVGPADVVEREYDAFLSLGRSFDMPAANSAPAPPAVAGGMAAPGSGGFAYALPDGWERAPDRSMRAVNLRAGADGSAECYVTELGGDGGGAFMNANRWRSQFGQPDFTQSEFAGLERFPMLGSEGVLVEAQGPFQGMSGESIADAKLLGVICPLPNTAVFVKMIGPSAVVEAEREAFLSFCKSLTQG